MLIMSLDLIQEEKTNSLAPHGGVSSKLTVLFPIVGGAGGRVDGMVWCGCKGSSDIIREFSPSGKTYSHNYRLCVFHDTEKNKRNRHAKGVTKL